MIRARKDKRTNRKPTPTSNHIVVEKDVMEGKKILVVADNGNPSQAAHSLFAGLSSELIGYSQFFQKPAFYKSDVLVFSCSERLSDPKRQQWVKKGLEAFRRNNPDSVILLCIDAPARLGVFAGFRHEGIIDAVEGKTETAEYRLVESARRILELRRTE